MLIEQRHLLHLQAHHELSALPQSRGQLTTTAIAAISDDDVTGDEREEVERLGGVSISDTHIDQASAQERIAQMHPPVVSTATRLLESGGIDEQDAWHASKLALCRRHRQQFAYQPEQPGTRLAQTFAPGDMRDIGPANQHGPTADVAERGGTQHIR